MLMIQSVCSGRILHVTVIRSRAVALAHLRSNFVHTCNVKLLEVWWLMYACVTLVVCGKAVGRHQRGRVQVRDLLVPLVTDQDVNVEVSGQAALALGIVFCGACEEECVGAALQARSIHSCATPHHPHTIITRCRAFLQDCVMSQATEAGITNCRVDLPSSSQISMMLIHR